MQQMTTVVPSASVAQEDGQQAIRQIFGSAAAVVAIVVVWAVLDLLLLKLATWASELVLPESYEAYYMLTELLQDAALVAVSTPAVSFLVLASFVLMVGCVPEVSAALGKPLGRAWRTTIQVVCYTVAVFASIAIMGVQSIPARDGSASAAVLVWSLVALIGVVVVGVSRRRGASIFTVNVRLAVLIAALPYGVVAVAILFDLISLAIVLALLAGALGIALLLCAILLPLFFWLSLVFRI